MTDLFHVNEPGLFTTIQDLGRPQAIASGVPPGGAMDRFAHTAANLLVGNDRAAATLECTLRGPQLVAARSCLVAITGGDFDLLINNTPAPLWTGLLLNEGDLLTLGKRRTGARAYIAAAGGISGDRWLASLSTNLMAVRGGMHGRPIAAGDVILAVEEPLQPLVTGRHVVPGLRPNYQDHSLRVIAGPHVKRLTSESREAMFGSTFGVSPDSDRMGYRLTGPRLDAPGDELLSFGLVAGVVQLPPSGNPIVLMADHQTAGGYPVVAGVISASMPVAAQLGPGDELHFQEVTIEAALAMRADQRAALEFTS